MSSAPRLGSVLRGYRIRYGWTLKEMSARVGIPVSTLSKVERGVASLTVERLHALSSRLGLRVADFFVDPAGGAGASEIRAWRSIGRRGTAVQVTTARYGYADLCADLRKKLMSPYEIDVTARSLAAFGAWVRHPGEEFLYILDGSVVVHTEQYAPVQLGAGDCHYIGAGMAHAYLLATDCERARALGVCCTGSEHRHDFFRSAQTACSELRPDARTTDRVL